LEPVAADQSYDVYGETIRLKVDAVDNVGVAGVQFDWWNPSTEQWVRIAQDTSSPYEIDFDTSALNPVCNTVHATAYDVDFNISGADISICLMPLTSPSIIVDPPSPNQGNYTVQWPAVSGAASYELQERKGAGSWTQIYEGELTSVTRSNMPAREYCYRARSIRAEASSDWSSLSCVTVDPTVNPPPVPEILAIANDDQSPNFLVQWQPSAGASRYQLHERQGMGLWTLIQEGPNTSYIALDKANGVWCYRVRALSEEGASDWSPAVCTTVGVIVEDLRLYLPSVLGGYE
jgi:hypothetical protein